MQQSTISHLAAYFEVVIQLLIYCILNSSYVYYTREGSYMFHEWRMKWGTTASTAVKVAVGYGR